MISAISPRACFRGSANELEVDPSFAVTVGGGARFNFRLRNNAHDGQAAVDAVVDGQGNVTTPAVPAKPDTIVTLIDDVVQMTVDQWNSWPAGSSNDDTYILQCVAQNLGLTLVSS